MHTKHIPIKIIPNNALILKSPYFFLPLPAHLSQGTGSPCEKQKHKRKKLISKIERGPEKAGEWRSRWITFRPRKRERATAVRTLAVTIRVWVSSGRSSRAARLGSSLWGTVTALAEEWSLSSTTSGLVTALDGKWGGKRYEEGRKAAMDSWDGRSR